RNIYRSIIIEWPKTVTRIAENNDRNHNSSVTIDHAPLIHRARSVIKSRTSHPTMRIRICAITKNEEKKAAHLKIVEAFFRATLIKLSSDSNDSRQAAGRLILTQREGTRVMKGQDHTGATVSAQGRLVISQADEATYSCIFPKEFGETLITTSFKYEDGSLCAVFPQLGVTLNSMVDRRQLTTRYSIQVEIALNINNQISVKHFLIAITNDQIEPLLTSIVWQRITGIDSLQQETSIEWGILRESIRNFVKSQYLSARALDVDEILHIQCILFLPRVVRCKKNQSDMLSLEELFFKNIVPDGGSTTVKKLKNRLLREPVVAEVLVSRHEFIQDKCISLSDCSTILDHNLWQWLYKATEMIIDVGHKYCPLATNFDKKCGLFFHSAEGNA
ncbi:unnamed protein product, partial [Dracunculus medinensis]|uniref:Mab-21 domain-containing protein n=1 Tax=Dracunculus medinensis TaxID=318479 RepID=A0A0N4U4K9_DRAME